MLNRIQSYIRNKPRTSALISVALFGATGLLIWDAQRGGSLFAFLPLAACLGMHGLMHGGHKHGHGQDRASPEAAPDIASAEPPVNGRDGAR